jgi:diaminohydroxyphosphoribosylaminopyrimidine deaminase / 5-amino-6-(5-phosphoribosylamino)uracil reductase
VSAGESTRAVDAIHMQRALALAVRGWGNTAPNPMVGAVVVAGTEIVGEGFHARYGESHAEVNALSAAGERARGATLYVSLEPCNHHGKTPPCTEAIISAGIARVVVAVRDPSAIARGGVERLTADAIRVDVGLERDRALELNAPFFNAHASDRPWVTLKIAISADGAIADPSGVHRWITGRESRAFAHHLRANADAIAVGSGTVLADDPSLTVRDAPPPRVAPRRVVFDRHLRTPADSTLARTAREIPTLVYALGSEAPAASRRALEAAGVHIDSTATDLVGALHSLRDAGVRALFVEAGPRLTGSFLREAVVDRLIIFRSPLVLGSSAPRAFADAPPRFEASLERCPIVERRQFGDDQMTIYALRDVPCSPD